jgi:hypothetical protein
VSDRIRLKVNDIWVSCSARELGPVGHNRHIIRKDGLVTVCGASASIPEVWRQNVAKPRCEQCVKKYVGEKKVNPVSRGKKRKTSPPPAKQTKVVPLSVSAADLHQITDDLDNLLYSALDIGKIVGFEILIPVKGSANEIKAKYDETTREWELEF